MNTPNICFLQIILIHKGLLRLLCKHKVHWERRMQKTKSFQTLKSVISHSVISHSNSSHGWIPQKKANGKLQFWIIRRWKTVRFKTLFKLCWCVFIHKVQCVFSWIQLLSTDIHGASLTSEHPQLLLHPPDLPDLFLNAILNWLHVPDC